MPAAAVATQLLLFAAIHTFATLTLLTLQPGLDSYPDELSDAALMVSLLPTALASGGIVIALIYGSIVFVHRRPFLESLGLRWPAAGELSAAAGLGVTTAMVGLVLVAIFPPDPETIPDGPLIRLLEQGGMGYVVWTTLAVVVAPVQEEVLFRGYAYLGARRRLGPAGAGLLTSAMFVALHVATTGSYWPALAGIATMSAVLVAMMEKRMNLVCCIAAHMAYNATLASLAMLGSG